MPHDERRDEVGDLARALARMQEELRRQEAARRAFVSTASHELRTPLTMLQGTMELLEEDLARRPASTSLDAPEQVETARRELNRLSALAGELLDLSRLDAAVPLRSEPVELGEIVRAVAAEFELRARERSTPIDVDPARGRVLGPRRPRRGRARRADPARQRAALRPARRAGLGRAHSTRGRRAVITVADRGPASRPRSASASSSASTAAAPRASRAASASAWRSGASWRAGWAASWRSTATAGRHALRAHAARRALPGRAAARASRDRVSA